MSARTLSDTINVIRLLTNLTETNFPKNATLVQYYSMSVRNLVEKAGSINPRSALLLTRTIDVSDGVESYSLPASVDRVAIVRYAPTGASPGDRMEIYPMESQDTDSYTIQRFQQTPIPTDRRFIVRGNFPRKELVLVPPPANGIPPEIFVEYIPRMPELHYGTTPTWSGTSLQFQSTAGGATGLVLRTSQHLYRDAVLRSVNVTGMSTTAGRGRYTFVTGFNPDDLTVSFSGGWLTEDANGAQVPAAAPAGASLAYEIVPPIHDQWADVAIRETCFLALGSDADRNRRAEYIDKVFPMSLDSLVESLQNQTVEAPWQTRDVNSWRGARLT